MALFVGEVETTIDGKRRLAVSSEFRQQIQPEMDGEEFILTLGPDRHLWLYPDRYYRRLLATLRRSPLPTRAAGQLTVFFGTARLVKPDSQGRIVLPDKSVSRAVLTDRVTLVGNDDHLEIWPTEQWDRHVEQMLPAYGETLYQAADRMAAESADQKET